TLDALPGSRHYCRVSPAVREGVRMLKRIGVAVVVLCAVSSWAFAQATASITGRVVDQAGAVLPGATVTVINTATRATRDSVTNAEGLYTVPALIARTYTVKADLAGFSAFSRDNLELLTGSPVGVEALLGLEGIQEFKTISTASAEYGKGTTTILLATKSGSNQLHGTVAAYGRNQDMMAIDYFSKPANGGTGKPPFNRYQYGGSIGGPLLKDK